MTHSNQDNSDEAKGNKKAYYSFSRHYFKMLRNS